MTETFAVKGKPDGGEPPRSHIKYSFVNLVVTKLNILYIIVALNTFYVFLWDFWNKTRQYLPFLKLYLFRTSSNLNCSTYGRAIRICCWFGSAGDPLCRLENMGDVWRLILNTKRKIIIYTINIIKVGKVIKKFNQNNNNNSPYLYRSSRPAWAKGCFWTIERSPDTDIPVADKPVVALMKANPSILTEEYC